MKERPGSNRSITARWECRYCGMRGVVEMDEQIRYRLRDLGIPK